MNYEEMTDTVVKRINSLPSGSIVAIDGRCASGKSSFGKIVSEMTGAVLLHMDDFFLRPEQRTAERYQTPGANVDYERFEEEVLKPLRVGTSYLYRPFDCRRMRLTQGKVMEPGRITLVEGSYSMHSKLIKYYDLKVFLTVDKEVQLKRIEARNPDKVTDFVKRWIPLEEKYFSACHPEMNADLIFDTTKLF